MEDAFHLRQTYENTPQGLKAMLILRLLTYGLKLVPFVEIAERAKG